MTFDDWWNNLPTREQARISKDNAAEIWDAATLSAQPLCQLTEADVRRIVREELKAYATIDYVSSAFRSYDRSWD